MVVSKFKDGSVHFRNFGVQVLTLEPEKQIVYSVNMVIYNEGNLNRYFNHCFIKKNVMYRIKGKLHAAQFNLFFYIVKKIKFVQIYVLYLI